MENKMRDIQQLNDIYLKDNVAVDEFDTIINRYKRKKMMGASIVALILIISISTHLAISSVAQKNMPSTSELLETVETLTNMEDDKIDNISVESRRGVILLTTNYTDGAIMKYSLKRSDDGSSIELIAHNTL